MSIPGRLEIDRADRQGLDRWATLRDPAMRAHDVLIEDLSETGCKILANFDLPRGTLIHVGISGAGRRAATIVRGSQPIYGCAFAEPMSDDDIRRATHADTVVAARFPTLPTPVAGAGEAWTPPVRSENEANRKRRVPLWVDVVVLFLIFLFAIRVWRLIPQ